MPKKRISLTIDSGILSGLDALVDDINIRSRSEAVESILRNYLKGNRTAVFLAGGKLERLKIGNIFKPLISINGKFLIVHNLEEIRKSGFNKAIIIGKSEILGEIFKKIGDGEKYDIEIIYIQERNILGNAKTLQLAEKYINSPFLVLPIDNYFTFDIAGLVKYHTTRMPISTLAVSASRLYSTNMGFVEMDGNRIIKYEENPKNPKSFLTAIFVGMYSPDVFDYIPKGNIRWILQKSIYPKLMDEGELEGYIISGNSVNVNKSEDISLIKRMDKE